MFGEFEILKFKLQAILKHKIILGILKPRLNKNACILKAETL